jgi:hypothetical protein
MKTILKLLVTAAIANAGWHVADAWMTFFKFKDAVTQASQFGGKLSNEDLQTRIADLATQYSIPQSDEGFTVRRQPGVQSHTYIQGSYTKPIEVFPRVFYPWTFRLDVDTFTEGNGGAVAR